MLLAELRSMLHVMPKNFLSILPKLYIKKSGYNRFLFEKYKRASKMWNAWLILRNLHPEVNKKLLALILWTVWNPKTNITNLNSYEVEFLEKLDYKLTTSKFYIFIDPSVILANDELVFFTDIYELIEIYFALHFAGIKKIRAVCLLNLQEYNISIEGIDFGWMKIMPLQIFTNNKSSKILCLGIPQIWTQDMPWLIVYDFIYQKKVVEKFEGRVVPICYL